ncbi:MAG: beta-lactamase family protein [Phycisphaeraceae bacterium]|nr:beta-lactamase family protein [Phycisphaeraceae bacterium]
MRIEKQLGLVVAVTLVSLGWFNGLSHGQSKPAESGAAGEAATTATATSDAAINPLSEEGLIRGWVVVGPFPNPELAAPLADGVVRKGYHEDYLKELGGEAQAELEVGKKIGFVDEQGAEQLATVNATEADGEGYVNFSVGAKSLVASGGSGAAGGAGVKVAYAFCYLDSPVDQKVYFHFGSDDAAKVWVNHQPVHTLWTLQRGAEKWNDNFAVELHKGLNPVLVKVDNRGGGWNFVLEVYSEKDNQKKLDERFLSDIGAWEIRPLEGQAFVFGGGSFPMLQWKEQDRIQRLVGAVPLKVRWFDRQLEEVTLPTQPGRYAALVEAELPAKVGGIKIRRGLTFVFLPGLEDRTRQAPQLSMAYPGEPFDAQAWQEQGGAISEYISKQMMPWLIREEAGAIVTAAMLEMRPKGEAAKQADSPGVFPGVLPGVLPGVMGQEFQLALKRKLLGLAPGESALKLPTKKAGAPAPVLRAGSEKEAGMKEGTAKKLHAICQEWYEVSQRPFAIVIARHGVIVYQEAFGQMDGKPATMETKFPLASITKTLAAQMFGQFVSQGLIKLDDPVGKFLPDFPVEGEKVITFRACFEFVSGYQGHGMWGGLENAWLENAMAAQLPQIHPHKVTYYNGMGHDLAAKAMEVVSGKSFIRLMQENYFGPLGINEATIEDAAYGTEASTLSLAKMSQVILNKGSYGQLEFYSPAVFEAFLPKPTEEFFPEVHDTRGVGLYPFGKGIVGGAAASSTIQWIDLDKDLIIVVGRIIQGKDYDKYTKQVRDAVYEGVAGDQKMPTLGD